MTLTEFLLARYAADERLARDAERTWSQVRIHYGTSASPEQRLAREAFVLNINPWRVLADIEGKRRIVQDHNVVHDGCPGSPTLVSDPDFQDGDYGGPCGVLRHLATVYADHPDYRQEWKP